MKNLQVNEETMALLGFQHTAHSEKHNMFKDEFAKEFYVQKRADSEETVLHKTYVTITQEESCYKLSIESYTGKDIRIYNDYESATETSLVNSLLKCLNIIDSRNREYFKMSSITSDIYKQYAGKYGSRNIGYDFCTIYIRSNILGVISICYNFNQLWIDPNKKVPATLEELVNLVNQKEIAEFKHMDDSWIDEAPAIPKQLTDAEINSQVDGPITKDDLSFIITAFERAINLLQMQLYEKTRKKRS